MSRFIPSFAVALALGLAACAAPTASDPVVTVAELRAHVEWLADDARAGRRAGTESERIAASYVAQQFARAGLQPAGDAGAWFQEFTIPLPPSLRHASLQIVGATVDEIGTLSCTANGSARGPLTTAPTAGSITLLRAGAHDATALRASLRAAAAAGAAGAVVGVHADELAAGAPERLGFDFAAGELPLPLVTAPSHSFTTLWRRTEAGERLTAELSVDVARNTTTSRNVLGLLPGSSPEVIVIGAHYDHLGLGGEGSLAPGSDAVHNGADDNASGTAVLIELAEEWREAYRAAAAADALPEVGILFAAWGAEEAGLLGSAHWVQSPTVPLAQVRANLNLDMVGRAASGAITVGSTETAAAFAPAIAAAQTRIAAAGMTLRLAVAQGALPGGGGSDHMSFHRAQVPALFFFSGLHADYHKPSDDAGLLDYPRMLEVAAAVREVMKELQAAARADFAWVAPAAAPGPGRAAREGGRPAGVWFGSIPDYAAAPEGGGMQIAGTSPGSPAEKAGLQAGDVIRGLDDAAIGDIYDFMDALGTFRNGQTIQVTLLRAGQTLTLPLTFFPRPGA